MMTMATDDIEYNIREIEASLNQSGLGDIECMESVTVHDVIQNTFKVYDRVGDNWVPRNIGPGFKPNSGNVYISRALLDGILAKLRQGLVACACKDLEKLKELTDSGAQQAPGMIANTDTALIGKQFTNADGKVRKRKPNVYNQYVSETMKMLTKERPELTSKQCMTVAVQMWKAKAALEAGKN